MGNDLSIPCPLPSHDHPGITGLIGQIPREDLNKKDVMGWTPLHVACWDNNVSAVTDLLSIPEVKVNERDVNDDTPVMVAAAYCCKEALEAMLLDRNVELDEKGLTEEYRLEEITGNVQGSSESKRIIRKAIRDERRMRYNCRQRHNCQQCQDSVEAPCQQRPIRHGESSEQGQHSLRLPCQHSHVRLGASSPHPLDSLGVPIQQKPTRPHRRSVADTSRRLQKIPATERLGMCRTPVSDRIGNSKTITGSVGTCSHQRQVAPRQWSASLGTKQTGSQEEEAACEQRRRQVQQEASIEDDDEIEELRSNVRKQYFQKIEDMKLKMQESEQGVFQNRVDKLKTIIDKLTEDLDNLDIENGTSKTVKPTGDKKEVGDLGPAQRELECPVCLNLMKPPTRIWMCSSSHLICQPCKELMRGNLCPTCRTVQVSIRALFAEHMANTLFAANLELELD